MALKHVNAVVIGAGAGGGIVAKELSEAGLSVVLLERGGWASFEDHDHDEPGHDRVAQRLRAHESCAVGDRGVGPLPLAMLLFQPQRLGVFACGHEDARLASSRPSGPWTAMRTGGSA